MNEVMNSPVLQLGRMLEARDIEGLLAQIESRFSGTSRDALRAILAGVPHTGLPQSTYRSLAETVQSMAPTGDGFGALGDRFLEHGMPDLALVALHHAGDLDFKAASATDTFPTGVNGQTIRQSILKELVGGAGIAAIVETEAGHGNTTSYFAQFQLPVYASERHARQFRYASLKLAHAANIRLFANDLRSFLTALFSENSLPSEPVLFFLGTGDITEDVWESVRLIFAAHPAPIVLIDDFRVPGDDGYYFFDQGIGRRRTVTDMCRAIPARPRMFLPRRPSSAETGLRRGCAIFTNEKLADVIRQSVPMLSEIDWQEALVLDQMMDVQHRLNTLNAGNADRQSLERQLHESTADLARAQFAQQQLNLQLECARLEASAARDAANAAKEFSEGLQTIIRLLHEDLREMRSRRASWKFWRR